MNIKVYGTLGSIEWHQMEPNTLIVKWLEKPMQLLRTGHPSLSEFAQKATRLPSGHPEGYIEAFANIYKNVALHILSRRNHDITYDGTVEDYPTIDDGVMGMHFLYKVVASHQKDATWIDV